MNWILFFGSSTLLTLLCAGALLLTHLKGAWNYIGLVQIAISCVYFCLVFYLAGQFGTGLQ